MGQVMQGVVKWFNDAKGFGFIEHASGQDVFVHYSVIDQDGFKTLKDGEPVEYELREGDKGLNASRVSRVNAPKSEETPSSEEEPKSSLEIDMEASGNQENQSDNFSQNESASSEEPNEENSNNTD